MIQAANQITQTSDVALRMSGISKSFGPVHALTNVTFTVRKGTVHALVGENGAGKSTLMKVLAGVHKPNTGQIEIHGQTVSFENPGQAIESGVSMIYQELDLAQHLSVAENIYLGEEPSGVLPFFLSQKKMVEETSELIRQYNFHIDPEAVVSNLSTGDCQVVEILKALRRKASIIVMDEPTSSLSEKEVEKLFEIVKQLKSEGISVIYISHRLEEISGLADEVSVLRDGEVVHCDSIENLSIPDIVHHMVGRELTDFYPQRNVEIGPERIRVQDMVISEGHEPLSFGIRQGEVVAMAGLVGAGRTETARVIFGVDRKVSGQFFIDGREVNVESPVDAIDAGIAYLTEDRKRSGLCLNLSCSWNITLPNLKKIGMSHVIQPSRESTIAKEVASKISIKWSGPEAAAESLSGGNQQKVLIARWLLADSHFIIFDEPTRGIDVGAKKEVYTLLNTLAQEGKAILIISSELPEVFGMSDRILVMRRGKLVADLNTKETNPDQVMHLAAVEE